ncbi:hypothetical protein IFO70_21030 [Phormidium tenue FACHB-886]|nr:hypothetical protein [Phormidium tenue FACHB-886]
MDTEEAIATLNTILAQKSLTDLQVSVFRQCWEGRSYSEIAAQLEYDIDYIKNIGAKLWKLLSNELGETITKSNIQIALRRSRNQLQNLKRGDQERYQSEQQSEVAQTRMNGTFVQTNACSSAVRQDWGDAVDGAVFYGRLEEVNQLEQWVLADHCRLLVVLGMGGMGKTVLTAKLARTLVETEAFQCMIWRSLHNAPPVDAIVADLIHFLSNGQETERDLPQPLEKRIARLMHYLRTGRCLLILDNAETILRSGDWAGYYRTGYEGYGELFNRIGEGTHQSCLIVTSRENPKHLEVLQSDTLPVRQLRLRGLDQIAGHQLLHSKGTFFGAEADWNTLIQRYAGNPLALKIVATTIQELFEGDIAAFLEQGLTIFEDIRALLEQQLSRLSPIEKAVMYWLAIVREPVSLSELQQYIMMPVPRGELLEAIQSLRRRSLIEKAEPTLVEKTPFSLRRSVACYTQQPVVMEYAIEQLIDHICQEVLSQQPALLIQYALLQASTKDHIRESQIRIIIEPLLQQLIAALQTTHAVEQQLTQILHKLQTGWKEHTSGYAPGNLLNLFRQLKTNLTGYDFSRLPIWQAYLQDVTLQQVNFAFADLSHSVFAQTLGSILSVAFSPDGQRLATSDADGEIQLWNVADGQPLFTCREHHHWVWSIAFSPDSQTLISGSEDRTIKLWQVNTGHCFRELQGHTHWVWAIGFSPDGQLIASASEDQTVKLWNPNTGECLQTLYGHTGGVCCLAFSSTHSLLASGSVDQTIRLWNVETEACVQILKGHTDRVRSVAFHPNGKLLATAGDDQTIRLWDTGTGECLNVLAHSSRVWSIAFSPDGRWLATGSDDQTIRLWDIRSGTGFKGLSGHTSRVWSVAFSPDGLLLASGSDDQTLRLWDSTGQSLRTLQGHNHWIWSIAYSPDGKRLASGSEDRAVRLWDSSTSECSGVLQGHTGRVWSVAFSPNGHLLASGSDDHTIRIWDVQTQACVRILSGHTRQVRMVDFSTDGKLLASGSGDQTAKLWEIGTGRCIRTLRGHTSWILAIGFSPDSSWLATGSNDRTLRCWDVNTGKCIQVFEGHQGEICSISVSPDGQYLASGSDDQTIRIWDVHGDCVHMMNCSGRILALAFSPDGQYLASGSSDQTIQVWDVKANQCLKTWQGHTQGVSSVVFHPHDGTLATASEDETIKLWQFQSGQCLNTLQITRLYEALNITGATGLTTAQRAALRAMGAIEDFDLH